jgi:hypothetical protein
MAENRFASDDAFAPEAAADEPASPAFPAPADAGDALAFAPVALRYRSDGLTPARQREFVEALADTGLIHVAAQRIGVSPQAVNRTRRRADARSFDLACAAAQRFGARGLHATAYERAIEGTIRRHYYHGELKSEERVFDNRLLIYLLGKTEHLLDDPPEAAAVAANWEPWVEAMEQGTPLPDIRPAWQRERDERLAGEDTDAQDEEIEEEDGDDCDDVWEDEDGGFWWTRFPPPEDFDGVEDGAVGEAGYRRSLTDAEQAAMAARNGEDDRELAEDILRACARRDNYFGFAAGLDTTMLDEGLLEATLQAGRGDFFFAREAETSETSAPVPESGPAVPPPPGPDGEEQPPEEAEISPSAEAGASMSSPEPAEPGGGRSGEGQPAAGPDRNCSAFPHDFEAPRAYVGRQEEQA